MTPGLGFSFHWEIIRLFITDLSSLLLLFEIIHENEKLNHCPKR